MSHSKMVFDDIKVYKPSGHHVQLPVTMCPQVSAPKDNGIVEIVGRRGAACNLFLNSPSQGTIGTYNRLIIWQEANNNLLVIRVEI